MKLKGIIVGGTGSIGKKLVTVLNNEGIDIAAIGRDNKKMSNVKPNNNFLKFYDCDITDQKNSNITIRKIIKDIKKIDFIVFAQGIAGITPTGSITENDWDKIFDINIKFSFLFAQEISNLMKKQKSGKIIFLSSIHGTKTYPNRLVYAASKSALDSVTRSMSIDLAKHNISVNSVAPGQLMTTMQKKLIKKNPKLKSFFNNIKSSTPTQRFTTVDDVAEIIKQLILTKNNQLTGTIIHVDGGITNLV